MAFQLTHRDEQTLLALQKLPLTGRQLFRLSVTFSASFPSERVLRRRMQRLAEEGMARRFHYAFPSNGRNPAYWRLTRRAYRLINELSGEEPLPRRSMFSPMGVSLHFHTHRLADVVVEFVIGARRIGATVDRLLVECSLQLGEGDSITPDATLELVSSEGKRYRFFIELDTASERIKTDQRIPSSIQRKLENYERYRCRSGQPFRVLFVTTSSKRRATNILRFSAGLSNNRAAQSVYAAHYPELIAADDCLTQSVFLNHRLEPTQLVRAPRFCQLGSVIVGRDRMIAHLSQKEFTPWWTPAMHSNVF